MAHFLLRFLIGREKEGVESEVARLINESLEMDKASTEVCLLKEEGRCNPDKHSVQFVPPYTFLCVRLTERERSWRRGQ